MTTAAATGTAAAAAPVPRSLRTRLLRWTLLAALIGTLTPALQCVLLNWIDPPLTLTMLGQTWAHWRATDQWQLPNYTWVNLQDVPRSVPVAALSTEDRSFFHHKGFDMVAIRRAWQRNQKHPGGRIAGGSTISQQVARNVFLSQHRSWVRKGLEAWYTVWLELLVPKRRILEVYINVAEMGPMVFGVQAAAQHWFRKPAAKLRPREAAIVMALLPSPRHWTPASGHVQRRATWIERLPAAMPRP